MEKKKKGVHLEFVDTQIRLIKDLMESTGLRTQTELFNNTLALFAWAHNEQKEGRKIASIDDSEKKIKELVMPALSPQLFNGITTNKE